jgi:hypothetical protein
VYQQKQICFFCPRTPNGFVSFVIIGACQSDPSYVTPMEPRTTVSALSDSAFLRIGMERQALPQSEPRQGRGRSLSTFHSGGRNCKPVFLPFPAGRSKQ